MQLLVAGSLKLRFCLEHKHVSRVVNPTTDSHAGLVGRELTRSPKTKTEGEVLVDNSSPKMKCWWCGYSWRCGAGGWILTEHQVMVVQFVTKGEVPVV